MIILALKLILAHLIGDFLLQPGHWVEKKLKRKHRSPYLYWHLAVHAVTSLLLLQFELKYLIGVLAIVTTHFLIDLSKINLNGRLNSKLLFGLDQLAHFAVIGLVVGYYFPFEIDFSLLLKPDILLFSIALLLVTSVSAILMRLVMSSWELKEDKEEDSLPKAGMYIGILERVFVFGFIALQQWQAIGLLIAAKSVFRFSDLSRAKDRKLTEYILIGTLLSFGLAIIIGLIYLFAIDSLHNTHQL